MNIENIYLSKLNNLRSLLETKSAKCERAEDVFKNVFDAVDFRINGLSSAMAASASTAAAEQSTEVKDYSTAEIESIIEKVASDINMDADLIRAVIYVESSYRTDAVSSAGAQGLMQLMPGTAADMGVTDPFDAYQNVKGGATYLKRQIDRFGDVRLALAGYNTGPARIARLEIADPNDPEEYAKISAGVRGYVDKVLKYYDRYRNESA